MFRPETAAAVAAFFLEKAPDHTLNDLVLMKLMVIAERKCIAETTSLITGARFCSMQNGPVLSEVLSLMRGEVPCELWQKCIHFAPHQGKGTASNHCVLNSEAGLDVTGYLSEYEIGLLRCVWKEHGHAAKWDLVQLTHTFPEWDATCAETKSSRPIALEAILECGLAQPAGVARARAAEIEYYESVVA